MDMELCKFNLENCIRRTWPPDFLFDHQWGNDPHLIWQIMGDISSGLAYIHALNEVHRDLKPQNSYTQHHTVH
jgi:serine/threonine protein kinase